jgi:tRNA threonylcarbamoyl adenosine modification protein YjeE
VIASPISSPATAEALANLAANLAAGAKAGDILLLEGPMGAGKTFFATAFIRALTGNPGLSVTSPTFSLVQVYDGPGFPLWHADLHRIKQPEEVEELGLDLAMADGMLLVEWPAPLLPFLPRRLGGYPTLRLDYATDPNQRLVELTFSHA